METSLTWFETGTRPPSRVGTGLGGASVAGRNRLTGGNHRTEFCIGLFNDSFPPIPDGVATTVYNYAKCLKLNNVRPIVVTPRVPHHDYPDEFEILPYLSTPLPKRKAYRLGFPWLDSRVNAALSRIPLEIVHAHSPFSAGRLALKVGRERNIPVVATFHSKFYDDFLHASNSKTAARLLLARVIDFFNRCDFVWTVNRATIDTLRSYGYRKSVEVAENGSDLVPAGNKTELREFIDKRLGLDGSENVLLFVGQHIWHKNVRLIIESLALLKAGDFRFRMLFVGNGEAEPDMKKLVNHLGLQDRVTFAGKVLDREYLKALYARADLFLFPSMYDTSGIVVQEAASQGTPSVMVRGSTAASVILDGYNGFLAENTAESLASTIKSAFCGHGTLARAGENARNTICRSWGSVLEEAKGRYEEIIKHWHGR